MLFCWPLRCKSSLFNRAHCLQTVLKKEGFVSLYRGALPNFLLIVPEKAIKLGVNDYMRHQLRKDGKISVSSDVIAGGTAGLCQVIITSPMEMMKIYGQDAGRIRAISGSSTIVTRSPINAVMHQHGFRGFYKGTTATLLRDIPFSMIYFPLFAFLNKPLTSTSDEDVRVNFWHTLGAATIAGGTAAAAVNPADVVKTRLQSIHQGTRKYDGIVDCITAIMKEEGPRTFLRGAQARAMAIAPLFGIAQSVYELRLGEILLGIPHNSVL